jgi:hypothetical protein
MTTEPSILPTNLTITSVLFHSQALTTLAAKSVPLRIVLDLNPPSPPHPPPVLSYL